MQKLLFTIVCKAWANKRLLSPDELIKGAKISKAAVLVDMVTDPQRKVFSS